MKFLYLQRSTIVMITFIGHQQRYTISNQKIVLIVLRAVPLHTISKLNRVLGHNSLPIRLAAKAEIHQGLSM